MPNVTTTIRELKNTDTGLDLTIAHYTEKHGLLKNSVTCNVVAVSNLQWFKGPQHSNIDVVQFMVVREFEDFENLRKKLVAKFPGTNIPSLPKTLFSLVEGSIKEQVASLEKFLKFIAARKKLATSSEVIEFLGFSITSVRKAQSDVKKGGLFEESQEQTALFQDRAEEDDEDEDLFRAALVSQTDEGHNKMSAKSSEAKLFAEQDFGDRIYKDDELVLFPGVADVPRVKHAPPVDEDLFVIDDNLEDMHLGSPKSEVTGHDLVRHKKSASEKLPVSAKPKILPKPTSSGQKVTPKSNNAANKNTSVKNVAGEEQESPTVEKSGLSTDDNNVLMELGASDILKYIEENSQEREDDDLFS